MRPFTAKDRDEFLMSGFIVQLEIQVSEDIRKRYRANRSLNELRQNMLSRSRLPRGIVTNTESRLQLKATEIEKFLKRKRKEKTPIQMWKDYVGEQVDNIVYRVKKDIDSGEEVMEQYEPSVNVPEEMPIRSFSTSLLPFLRSDLSVDIRYAFPDPIDQVLVSESNYIVAYGIQLYKLVLLLKSTAFIDEGNNIIVLKEQYGVNI